MKRAKWLLVAGWFVVYRQGSYQTGQRTNPGDQIVGTYPSKDIAEDMAEALKAANERRTVFVEPPRPEDNNGQVFTTSTVRDEPELPK